MPQLPRYVVAQQAEREQQPQDHGRNASGQHQRLEELREIVQELCDEDLHPLGSVQEALQERRMGWNGRRVCRFEPKITDR